MVRCRRCNRMLKKEPYASLGIGKICAGKEYGTEGTQTYGDADKIVAYDGGDIFIERDGDIRTNAQRTIYRHSPTGFNFGYGGSGAADLALNILVMFVRVPDAVTPAIYQDFKWKYIATATGARLDIKRKDITSFLRKHKIKTK